MSSAAALDDLSTSTYKPAHRAFLQSFLAHSTLTLTSARPILARILTVADSDERPTLTNDITQADFTEYINAINAAITPFDMEIRGGYAQGVVSAANTNGHGAQIDMNGTAQNANQNEMVYALVNTSSDIATQLATTHSPDAIAFVKRLLDAMFEGPGTAGGREIFAVTEMQALNLHRVSARDRASGVGATRRATQAAVADDEEDEDEEGGESTQRSGGGGTQSITLAQATSVLASLVSEGWLSRASEPGARKHYVLSTRGLLELREWLRATYNEPDDPADADEEDEEPVQRVKSCWGCTQIVISGQRCGTGSCGVRIHDRCVAAVMRAQRGGPGERKCPKCQREWSGRDFVGVRAVKEIREKWLRFLMSQGANGDVDGVGEDEEEDDEE